MTKYLCPWLLLALVASQGVAQEGSVSDALERVDEVLEDVSRDMRAMKRVRARVASTTPDALGWTASDPAAEARVLTFATRSGIERSYGLLPLPGNYTSRVLRDPEGGMHVPDVVGFLEHAVVVTAPRAMVHADLDTIEAAQGAIDEAWDEVMADRLEAQVPDLPEGWPDATRVDGFAHGVRVEWGDVEPFQPRGVDRIAYRFGPGGDWTVLGR